MITSYFSGRDKILFDEVPSRENQNTSNRWSSFFPHSSPTEDLPQEINKDKYSLLYDTASESSEDSGIENSTMRHNVDVIREVLEEQDLDDPHVWTRDLYKVDPMVQAQGAAKIDELFRNLPTNLDLPGIAVFPSPSHPYSPLDLDPRMLPDIPTSSNYTLDFDPRILPEISPTSDRTYRED